MYDQNAHFYSFFSTVQNDLSPKASFVLKELTRVNGDCVLDVGSGTGDLALALAASNVSVTCVEPSAAMRSVFLSRITDNRNFDKNVTLLSGDILNLSLSRTYPVVCALSVLFLLKDRSRQKQALCNLRDHLTPNDGSLIVNFLLQNNLKEKERMLIGERKLGHVSYRHFSEKKFIDGHWTVIWSFETWVGENCVEILTEEFSLLYNTFDDCATMLRDAGLTLVQAFGDFHGASFDSEKSTSLVALLKCNRSV